jgi:hypothetical protein
MPAITIDQRSALVLIDLQKGILALPTLPGDTLDGRPVGLAAGGPITRTSRRSENAGI